MRTVNKVILVGNVSWNPKIRHIEGNKAVCSFGLATNRNWTTDAGEKHEETDFHRIVAWGKLAEICQEYLSKGRKVYVEGRLHTHTWTDNEGVERMETEIYIDEMVMLDSKVQETKIEPVQQSDSQQAATLV
jgi:single-strand DNA-binding protein